MQVGTVVNFQSVNLKFLKFFNIHFHFIIHPYIYQIFYYYALNFMVSIGLLKLLLEFVFIKYYSGLENCYSVIISLNNVTLTESQFALLFVKISMSVL